MKRLKNLMKSPILTWGEQISNLYYTKINQHRNSDYPKSIFVLSTGRAGTATLAELGKLRSRNILALHEPTPTLYSLGKMLYEKNDMGKHVETCVYEARRFLFQRAANSKRTYFETSPQCTFLAPLLDHITASPRFIHIIRDKNAFIKSGITRKWYITNANDRFRLNAPEHYSQSDKISWLYDTTNEWIEGFLDTQNKTNYITLKSEDLFNGSYKCIKSIFDLAQSPMPSQKNIAKVLNKKINANP